MLAARTRRRRLWHRKRRGVKTTAKSANRIKDRKSLSTAIKKNKKKVTRNASKNIIEDLP